MTGKAAVALVACVSLAAAFSSLPETVPRAPRRGALTRHACASGPSGLQMSAQSSTRMKLLALVTALFIGGSAPQTARAKVATYSPDTDFSRMPSVVTWSPSTAKPLAEIERKAIDQRILDTQLQESRQQMEAELGGGSGSGGGGVLARVLDLVLTAAVYGVFDHVHHGPVSDFLAQHQDAAAAPTPPARAWHSVSPADAAKATMLAGLVSGVGFVAVSVWSALSQKAGAGAGAGGRSLWQGLRASIPVLSQRQARTAVPPAAGPEDEDAALALESGGGGFGAPAPSLRAGGRASQLLTSDFPGPHFEVTSAAQEDAVAAAAAAAQRRAYYDEYVADLSSKRAAEEEALKSRASSTGLARDSGNAGLSGAESKDAGAKGNDYQRRLDKIGEAVRKNDAVVVSAAAVAKASQELARLTEEASETLTLLEAKDSDTLTLLKAKERLADAGAGAPPPPPTPPASIVPQAIPRPQPTARVKPASPTSSVAPPSQSVSSMTSKTEDSSAAAAAMFKRFDDALAAQASDLTAAADMASGAAAPEHDEGVTATGVAGDVAMTDVEVKHGMALLSQDYDSSSAQTDVLSAMVAARREAGKAKDETEDKEEAVAVARDSGNSSIKSPRADSSVARGAKAAPPEGTDLRRAGADENTAATAAAASDAPALLPKPQKPMAPKGGDVLSSVQKSSLASPAFKSNIAQSNFSRKKEKIKESKDIDQNA